MPPSTAGRDARRYSRATRLAEITLPPSLKLWWTGRSGARPPGGQGISYVKELTTRPEDATAAGLRQGKTYCINTKARQPGKRRKDPHPGAHDPRRSKPQGQTRSHGWLPRVGPELTVGERYGEKLGFPILTWRIIFDRNSRVGFHKLMETAGLKNHLGSASCLGWH
jgi:hypothetical protein